MNRLIATFFGTGLAPVAPGTFGSLAAVAAWLLIDWLAGGWLIVCAIVLVVYVGVRATRIETQGQENHDPSEIVIDEVAGQWIALLPLSFGLGPSLLVGVVSAFLLFRFFDITKLGPIGWADRMSTPEGVMLDDVLAGLAAAICVILLGLTGV